MHLWVTGGTGLVGRRLVRTAGEVGHHVVVLSRSGENARSMLPASVDVVEGDPTEAGAWHTQAAACDAIVNLAGENLFARRWNNAFKDTLRRSRVDSTARVAEVFGREDRRARVLVSASAVGYYGHSEHATFRESDPPGDGELDRICVAWEDEAARAAQAGARVVMMRIGIVLGPTGGALASMLPPFRWFVGGPVGSGRQVMSWIHIDDLVGLILHALESDSLAGPVNAAAPHPVTNREFARTLGRVLGRPSFVRTPGFALKLMLGQVADLMLTGQRVLPDKAMGSGYRFRFPRLEDALRDLL